MRAVIYKRVSVVNRNLDGTSLDVQQDRLEAYARAHGWEVIGTYEDAGISAKDTNRPSLQRMLTHAEERRFDVILVYKLDRLSRSVSDFHKLSNFLDQHQVALVSVTQNLDTSSPSGRLLRNILVDFANFERELITERVVDNKTHRAQEGKWNGGHAPFGYKLINKKIELVPEEAAQVKEVYELYLKRMSMRNIARKTGISFSKVELILMNPIYAGKLAWGKTKYKDHKGMFQRIKKENWIIADSDHVPIITFEEWEKAQEIKKSKKNIPDSRNENQLFKDLCFCGKCGRKMYFFSGYANYHYYRCHDVNRFEGCRSMSVRHDELEIKMIRKINDIYEDKGFWKQADLNLKSFDSSNLLNKQLSDIDNRIKKTDNQIKRLINQLADSDISHMIKPKLLELEQEKKILNEQRADLDFTPKKSNLTKSIMNEIMSNWDRLEPIEKSEGFHILIKQITIHDDSVEMEWTDSNIPKVNFKLDKRAKNGTILKVCF